MGEGLLMVKLLSNLESDGGSIPTPPLHPKSLILTIDKTGKAQEIIREYHYLHNAPPALSGPHFLVWFGERITGAMLWGRPVSRMLPQKTWLELRRFWLVDDMPTNSESRCLAIAVKCIRKLCPSIEVVLAYSQLSAGHVGTIYKAAGWQFAWLSSGEGGASYPTGQRYKTRLNWHQPTGSKKAWIKKLKPDAIINVKIYGHGTKEPYTPK